MNTVPHRGSLVRGVDDSCSALRLAVNVLATSERETFAALETATALAHELNADIAILSFQVVPYPLDLHQPDVPPSFQIARWVRAARRLGGNVHIQISYCREYAEAFAGALAPEAPIVIGRRKRWWPQRESRLIRSLRSCGHDPVIVETR